MGFRLHSFQISGHPVLKSTTVVICDDKKSFPVVYTTGIIGANGAGKSYLMAAIASVFSEINRVKQTGRPGIRRFSFTVEYEFDGDLYRVTNLRLAGGFRLLDKENSQYDTYYVTKNGNPIELNKLKLPERVIASTMTVTDKFVAKSDGFYRYKGIRNEKSASTTGTRTIIRKTVESLMDCMVEKNAFQEELRILLNNLGLEEHLHVSYGMRYKNIFLRQDMSAEMLRSKFDNWKDTFGDRENAPWGYYNYTKLRDNDQAMHAAAHFLSRYSARQDKGRSVVVTYDVMENPQHFQQDAVALRVLTQLDLVSFPSINVIKKGSHFVFENSSSGETHLLCQFIGIMADIKHNSLILIDEPENSSHPDWQMNYVGWLKDIFKDYNDSHFIITTHSPLILANMKASESTIVRLKRDEHNHVVEEGGMQNGCYSWTVDEILQDVMEMKKENTEEYTMTIKAFEEAVKNKDRKAADFSYYQLLQMINPRNELLELLKIQKAAIDDD